MYKFSKSWSMTKKGHQKFFSNLVAFENVVGKNIFVKSTPMPAVQLEDFPLLNPNV